MAFDNTKVNKILTTADAGAVNIRETPSFNAPVLVKVAVGQPGGRSTGQYLQMSDGNWFQVNLYKPVNGKTYGYAPEFYKGKKNISFTEPNSNNNQQAENNAQKLVDDVVSTDKKVYEGIYRSYIKMLSLQNKGVTIPLQLQAKLASVYITLRDRQDKMLKSGYIESYKTGTPEKYVSYKTSLNNAMIAHMNNGHFMRGIGVIPVIAWIIIAAVVGASSAAVAYYAFKPNYEDSKRDLKIIDELEKALNTLTPEEKEKVVDNLEKQVDDAYNAGKTDQKVKDTFSFGAIGKYLLMGFLGFILIDKFLAKRNQRKTT